MKPDPIEQEDKKIRALMKEFLELNRAINNPPSVRLDEPIQQGWVRRYVLTKEAEMRPDREVLAAILHDIGPIAYSRHPLFLKKKHRRSRKLVDIEQPLNAILIDRWSLKRHPRPDEWKSYFHLEYLPHWCGFKWFYIFTDAHLFELQVKPHWLTHLRLIDPLLVERQAEVDAWLENNHGWFRYRRSKGKTARWRCTIRRCDLLNKEAKVDLRRFLTSPEEAEVRPYNRWLHFSFLVFPHVAQCRGTPLRTETVRVQVLPWGPFLLS